MSTSNGSLLGRPTPRVERRTDGSTAVQDRLAAAVDPAQAQSLAATSALNAIAALGTVVDLDSIVRVVKVTGYVASAPGFTGQPGVVNGASDLIKVAFGNAGAHARTSVGVAELPLDSPVEIDMVVEIADAHRPHR